VVILNIVVPDYLDYLKTTRKMNRAADYADYADFFFEQESPSPSAQNEICARSADAIYSLINSPHREAEQEMGVSWSFNYRRHGCGDRYSRFLRMAY
jgi:hypothetical protein